MKSIPGLLQRLQIRAMASRYDNPIPTQFLAPIDFSKIPAQDDSSMLGDSPAMQVWMRVSVHCTVPMSRLLVIVSLHIIKQLFKGTGSPDDIFWKAFYI